jgi:ABC-2 type transport system permease protein
MSWLVEEGQAMAAVVQRDWRVTLSYRTRFFTHLLSVFFSVTLFHFISQLVHAASFTRAGAYFGFVVIGLVTLQVLNSTLQIPPGALRGELMAGTFERFLLSPLGATAGIVAMMIFPFLYALVTGLAMLLFAGLVFSVHLHWTTLPLMVPIGLLGALSFAPFGVLFLAAVLLSKQSISGATFVIAGISLIAGLYFPVSLLPAWMRWLSQVQPFTPAVDLMRHVMVGTHLHQALAIELLKVFGFTAVLLPLALLVLNRALRFGQRRGSILEY